MTVLAWLVRSILQAGQFCIKGDV